MKQDLVTRFPITKSKTVNSFYLWHKMGVYPGFWSRQPLTAASSLSHLGFLLVYFPKQKRTNTDIDFRLNSFSPSSALNLDWKQKAFLTPEEFKPLPGRL